MTPILGCWQHRGRVVCVPRILVGQHDRRAPRRAFSVDGTRWRCGVAECHLQQRLWLRLEPRVAGFFPYPILDNNGSNWDLMVVTHETGHNCSAPHPQRRDRPVWLRLRGLSRDPPPPTDCSAAQLGVATIMSYCHTCPGGIATCVWSFHIESDYLIPAINNASCLVTCPEPCPADVNGDTEVALMTW